MRQLSYTIASFDRLVQVFILLAVCGYSSVLSQAGFQLEVLDIGGPLLFAAMLMSGRMRDINNPAAGALVIACLWTTAWLSLTEYPVALIHVLAGCLAYYAIVNGVREPRCIARALVLAGCVNMVVALFQKLGYDLMYVVIPANAVIQKQHLSMAGIMGRNYHLAYLLAVTSPLAFYLDMWLGLFYTAIAGVFIVMVGSFAIMLAFAVTLLFALSRWVSLRIMCTAATMAMFCVCLVLWHTILGKVEWRIPAYYFCVRDSFMNPFIGHGLGNFQNVKGFDSSFNVVFRLMYELGLLPLAVLAVVVFKHYSRLLVVYRSLTASVVALLVYPMFHDSTMFARLMVMSIAVLALYEAESAN